MLLPPSFYTRTDVVQIARELLGKVLVTSIGERYTSGMITETEAYAGPLDKASHAFGNRRTRRTEPMFGEGGIAYVYLCYGIHHLFNVVTHGAGVPHAVLIRAVQPLDGTDIMLERRGMVEMKPSLTAGPGAMSAALGITSMLTGVSLQGPQVYIEDRGFKMPLGDIAAASRVGVAYAKEDALLPYRFFLKGNKFVSKAKGL
jgi:DNA-3-methyladenine glycosylase